VTATYTQVNQGDSQLLVVGSQIGTLTPSPSLCYNLCLKYLNGMCEPILDIYAPRTFHEKIFNLMSFDPYDCSLKIRESIGSVWVHSFTPSYTPKSMKCDSRASL
jgi:hypothetical protein